VAREKTDESLVGGVTEKSEELHRTRAKVLPSRSRKERNQKG